MKKQKHDTSPAYELPVINSLDDIPRFASEHEEWEFWQTHGFSDELWDSLPNVTEDFGDVVLTKRARVTEVCSWDEVPEFASEAEESSWWEHREPTWELLQTLPDRQVMPTRLESLRGFVKLARAHAVEGKRKVP